jgi:acetyl-CoA carboxylase carboxyl transferase subunit alpha
MNINHEHTAGGGGSSPAREYLDFEQPLVALQGQIAELKEYLNAEGIDFSPEIRRLEQDLARQTSRIYKNLSAWETVQVARHPRRPVLWDYLEEMCQDFCELHGDRTFADDPAIITGFGRIEREKVMLIGHNKGRDIKEKTACHFGCAHPEGYRKALGKMKLAEKFHLPIVCLIDTPGAYPGIGAEERGQAQAIAQSLMEMFRMRVPILCLVIGEGGSGGALGIGIGDQMAMLQYAYYSVISPEGCASILWKDKARAPEAAAALKLTAPDVIKHKVIDEVISEPLGGAHRNPRETIHNVKGYIMKKLRDLREYDIETLLEKRYQKFRTLGECKLQDAQSGKTEIEIALSEIQQIAQCTTP